MKISPLFLMFLKTSSMWNGRLEISQTLAMNWLVTRSTVMGSRGISYFPLFFKNSLFYLLHIFLKIIINWKRTIGSTVYSLLFFLYSKDHSPRKTAWNFWPEKNFFESNSTCRDSTKVCTFACYRSGYFQWPATW